MVVHTLYCTYLSICTLLYLMYSFIRSWIYGLGLSQGKTVTLKLKNVNFEVRSRALTLPCAVATAEEIFAVAKDLLKTEIDSVSPQPLRLRLMGVRISAFVNSDDKKPLQKSIVGFLKQGGADSSGPFQVSSPKETEAVLKSLTQPQTSSCPPLLDQTQGPPGQEVATWGASRSRVEDGRPGGQQEQSFFHRARAQRLRLQAEKDEALRDGDPQVNTTDTNLNSRDSSTEMQTSRRPAPDTALSSDPSTEAHASTSDWGSTDPEAPTDSLTCPVCFRKVRTIDLAVFNRHIDQCLGGVTSGPNHQPDSSDSDSESHPNMEPDRRQGENKETKVRRTEEDRDSYRLDLAVPRVTDSCTGETQSLAVTAPDYSVASSSNGSALNSLGLSIDYCDIPPHGGVFKPNRGDHPPDSDTNVPNSRVSASDPGSEASLPSESHDLQRLALTCPVCQVTQDTDDLTIFNRHVDLCLNQGMLHELGGQTTVHWPSLPGTCIKVKEKEPNPQRVTHKGKSKRRGSSPPPPSKKTKAPGPQNTIDRFFR